MRYVTVISKDSGKYYRYKGTPDEGIDFWASQKHTVLVGWYYSPDELNSMRLK